MLEGGLTGRLLRGRGKTLTCTSAPLLQAPLHKVESRPINHLKMHQLSITSVHMHAAHNGGPSPPHWCPFLPVVIKSQK